MGILAWIVLGLLAGIIAKFVMPGSQGGGLIMTTILGVIGAFVGGWIGTQLGWGDISGFDLRSIGLAAGGTVIVLFIVGQLRKK